jgi:hypothetical protein
MGLLDDAIREHLDLQRRRGADPTEIERAEQEALGPVRREPIGSEDAPGGEVSEPQAVEADPSLSEGAPPAEHAGHAYGAGESFGNEFEDARPLDDDESWEDLDEDGYEEDGDLEPGPPGVDPELAGSAASSHEAHPGLTPPPPDPDAALGDTVSYEAEPERPGPSQDDVLEETPEFLQDTPDHDRLWFEQRPPRDFDFDE